MNIVARICKILAIIIGAIIILLLLTVGVLSIAKFPIYSDYYSVSDSLCKNPGLDDGFVCQGIAAVDDEDLIIVSGYMADKSASRIYVTTLENESYYVTLNRNGEAYTGHAGGISTSSGKVFIANGNKIYTFPLDSLLNAECGDDINIGEGHKVNNKASFLFCDDEYLYVGSFFDKSTTRVDEHIFDTEEGEHYAICSQYKIDDLSAPVKVYSIRDYVQGICFTPSGKVIMSTSHGLTSSVYYVYNLDEATETDKTLDGAPVYYLDKLDYEISGPAMAEGLDLYDGKVITLTESASNKYFFGKLFFARNITTLDIA